MSSSRRVGKENQCTFDSMRTQLRRRQSRERSRRGQSGKGSEFEFCPPHEHAHGRPSSADDVHGREGGLMIDAINGHIADSTLNQRPEFRRREAVHFYGLALGKLISIIARRERVKAV